VKERVEARVEARVDTRVEARDEDRSGGSGLISNWETTNYEFLLGMQRLSVIKSKGGEKRARRVGEVSAGRRENDKKSGGSRVGGSSSGNGVAGRK
jgi:hypothetical protein